MYKHERGKAQCHTMFLTPFSQLTTFLTLPKTKPIHNFYILRFSLPPSSKHHPNSKHQLWLLRLIHSWGWLREAFKDDDDSWESFSSLWSTKEMHKIGTVASLLLFGLYSDFWTEQKENGDAGIQCCHLLSCCLPPKLPHYLPP